MTTLEKQVYSCVDRIIIAIKNDDKTSGKEVKEATQAINTIIANKCNEARNKAWAEFDDILTSTAQFRKPDDELDRGIQIGYDTLKAELQERLAELTKGGNNE